MEDLAPENCDASTQTNEVESIDATTQADMFLDCSSPLNLSTSQTGETVSDADKLTA